MFPTFSRAFSRVDDHTLPLPKALRRLDARTLVDIGFEGGLIQRDLEATASRNLLSILGVPNGGRR
jgi:hypothetical protein